MQSWHTRIGAAFLLVAVLWTGPVPAWAFDVDPQGQHASLNGGHFEHRIQKSLKAHGFEVLSHAEWRDMGQPRGEYLLTNAPYTTLYGTAGRTEFLLLSARRNMEIRIEAKYQSVSGSVDEKLPYVYLSLVEAVPEKTVFVVIDGPGWRPGSIDWLRRAAVERRYGTPADKTVRVFSLEEFLGWAEALGQTAKN
ncbi:MAG: 4-diphosphocytidyl-2C-methyl-D-erythritol kinase [Rhodospirillaceae bacterium]|nr:4-diphosphocytidyl-2C-methyl-D-erythritol kinase [Rhodospirillales bacterium]